MQSFLEKNQNIILILSLGFMFLVSVLNAKNESAIFDETAHIGAAYSYVTQREMRLNPEHPPLIKDLAGIPLLFMDLKFDTSQPFWSGDLPGKWDEGQWVSGRHLLYQAGNNADKIIFWSRFPIIILSLLLGLFIFKWSKELGGMVAGILALILYSFDPNILGHNHFVTTDLGIAAFLTFAFYCYLKFIKHPSFKNMLWAGLFLGFLQLAKFSSIIAWPVFGAVTIIYPLVTHVPTEEKNRIIFRLKKIWEYIWKGATVFSVSILVVWSIYALNTLNMTKETVSKAIDANFSPSNTENPKNVYTNKILHRLNENPITRPLSEYGLGLGYVFRRVAGGNGAYFMEQVSSKAFPAYFPVVFSIKEPLPTLFLMLFALILGSIKAVSVLLRSSGGFASRALRNLSNYVRNHIIDFSLLSFIILYSYVSITGNLNIGFRHLFPILPFIFILTAKTLANFLKNKIHLHQLIPSYGHNSSQAIELAIKEKEEKQKIKIFSVSFMFLIGYLVLGTVLAYPNYMSYFNEIAGGPKNGFRYVTDSNADWGQDLKRLVTFLENHPEIDKIRVDYFGGGDIKYYLGDKYIMWWDSKRPIEPGWYAISTNFLQGSIYDKQKKYEDSYRWLKNKKPAYQVGTSILIYKISEDQIPN